MGGGLTFDTGIRRGRQEERKAIIEFLGGLANDYDTIGSPSVSNALALAVLLIERGGHLAHHPTRLEQDA